MSVELEIVETSGVTLSEDLVALGERLARHAHDESVRRRRAGGWRYGPHYDEAAKIDPRLVPWNRVTEPDKQDRRALALETLRAVQALGYKVEPDGARRGTSGETPSADSDPPAALTALASADAGDLGSLLRVWRARDPERWGRSPDLYRLLAQRMLAAGEPLLAYDVTREGLQHWSRDMRLRQLGGLALARSGAPERARALLEQLYAEGHTDEETVGLLARVHKDLWTRATDPAECEAHLRGAAELYAEAYRLHGGYWSGINAATMAMLRGEMDHATALARRVREQCLAELERLEAKAGDTYWALATLGEAALIGGDWSEAEGWYVRAAAVSHRRFGDVASTRRNARLLAERLGVDHRRIDRALRVPRVALFAGSLSGWPDGLMPALSPSVEHAVRLAIRDRLSTLDCRVGYASAASGPDVLFLEAILELAGEVYVVLPYAQEEFLRDAALIVRDTDWGSRWERVLRDASQVIVASEQKLVAGAATYDYADLVLRGLAANRAEQLDTELTPLALRGGRPAAERDPGADGAGRERPRPIEIVAVDDPRWASTPSSGPVDRVGALTIPPPPRDGLSFSTEIVAMLFADAVGFSKLTDEEVPHFVEHFLGAVAALIDRSLYPPLTRNTWGDGLYFVFSGVRQAGLFALELCDVVTATDWTAKGLPDSLSLRIALHVGPVYRCIEPVTGDVNYIGAHVSRAARIEPITPPGHVYASLGFAALTSATDVTDFGCDYVGQTPLAKGYGTFPTYHVRRR